MRTEFHGNGFFDRVLSVFAFRGNNKRNWLVAGSSTQNK